MPAARTIYHDVMKISDLKEGMLLRFTETKTYRYTTDVYKNTDIMWLYINHASTEQQIKSRPLMIYLGQKKLLSTSIGCEWRIVQTIAIDGKVACIDPEMWRYIEPVAGPLDNLLVEE